MKRIHSISEIINFRYNKKFLSRDWWGGDFPRDFDIYSDNLKYPPAVYDYFRYVLHSGIKDNKQCANKDVFCYSNDQHLIKELVSKYPINFGKLVLILLITLTI